MNRALPGRTFFTAAYILLAIGFLTIHFTRVESFSTVVDGIVIKGRSSIGTTVAPPQIRRLKVSVSGLELLFRKGDKAILITDDGIRHPLNVIEWSSDEKSISVGMENETGFTLVSDPHGTGITLIPRIPTTEPPVRSLELPLRPGNGTNISIPQNRPGTLAITIRNEEYIASLPSDSSWNAENGRLNLVVLNKADPVLSISDDERGGGMGAVEWYEQASTPSDNAYGNSVKTWLAAARNGWDSRVDSRAGLWFDEKGEARWDDQLAASILADSVEQGLLTSKLQSVMSIGEKAPREIGWLPSPYLGNIVNQSRIRETELRSTARSLAAGMEEGNPGFGVARALGTLLDSGMANEAARMTNLARTSLPPEAANSEVIHRISILHEAKALSIDDAVGDPALRKALVEQFILPRVFWVKDGLWLVEEDGSINLPLSIAAGVLLLQEAQWSNDALYQSVGRQLIISALLYSNAQGMIPERILFETDGDVIREGLVSPERFYASIVSPPAYPRHVSLAQELGSGSWALTGAERFTLRSTPRETTITMDFPAGAIHHLAIRGIKKFNVLYMNGIRWNGDPNFQRYYAGWFYDEVNETLYVKIRHRAKTETLRILYYDPDAAAAVPAAEEEGA